MRQRVLKTHSANSGESDGADLLIPYHERNGKGEKQIITIIISKDCFKFEVHIKDANLVQISIKKH
jgi:hypothetical protein